MEPPSPNESGHPPVPDGGSSQARISSGLQVLDQRLSGGFPAGSMVSLFGPPTAPSELYCHQLALAHAEGGKPSLTNSVDVQRDVLYVATDTPTRRAAPDNDAITYYDTLSDVLDVLPEKPEDAPGESDTVPVVVVDRFSDILFEDRGGDNDHQTADESAEWFNALQDLSEHVAAGDTLALVHLHIPDDRAYSRTESRVFSMADAVLNYQSPLREDRADSLAIPKIRGASPPEDRIPLEVSDTLEINPDRQL